MHLLSMWLPISIHQATPDHCDVLYYEATHFVLNTDKVARCLFNARKELYELRYLFFDTGYNIDHVDWSTAVEYTDADYSAMFGYCRVSSERYSPSFKLCATDFPHHQGSQEKDKTALRKVTKTTRLNEPKQQNFSRANNSIVVDDTNRPLPEGMPAATPALVPVADVLPEVAALRLENDFLRQERERRGERTSGSSGVIVI